MADADYPAVVDIWNRVVVNEVTTIEQMRHDDAGVEPPRRAGRLVAEQDARVVGAADYGQPLGMFHPEKFYLHVVVDPDEQGTGIGRQLYDALLVELAVYDPQRLRVDVAESHPFALGFATRRGFVQDKVDWQQILELEAFDPDFHAARVSRVVDSGIRLVSMADLDDEANHRRFFHLFNDVRRDVPRTEPPTDLTFEQFQRNVTHAPDYCAAGTFVAIDGAEMVGLTMSFDAGEPVELHTGNTSVMRSHRNRGIATALKLVALAWGKNNGRVRAVVDNDVNNVEMLAVNARLGFVKQPAVISLFNDLRPPR